MVSKNLCIHVLLTKVALALEGLTHPCLKYFISSVVLTYDISENSFDTIHELEYDLNEMW